MPPFFFYELQTNSKFADGAETDLWYLFLKIASYIWLESRRPSKTLCFRGERAVSPGFNLFLVNYKKKRQMGEISLTTRWLKAGPFEVRGLAPGLVVCKCKRSLGSVFEQRIQPMSDDGNSFKGKKSGLMWLAQLCIVIFSNACVRMQCKCLNHVFYLVRGLSECRGAASHQCSLFCSTPHAWCQKHSLPALHLHFKSTAVKTRAPHFYFIFLPFPLLSCWEELPVQTDPCPHIKNTPLSLWRSYTHWPQLTPSESSIFQ